MAVASTAENKCFRLKLTLHHDAPHILTIIGSATNVGQTVCCWMVSAGTLNMVQLASTGQGEISKISRSEEHI